MLRYPGSNIAKELDSIFILFFQRRERAVFSFGYCIFPLTFVNKTCL